MPKYYQRIIPDKVESYTVVGGLLTDEKDLLVGDKVIDTDKQTREVVISVDATVTTEPDKA